MENNILTLVGLSMALDNSEKLNIFLNQMRKKEFFNVYSKAPEKFGIDTSFPIQVGQPASFSDQGLMPTCASHALGKAVVSILDSFGLDCDQESIIKELIDKVQPFSRSINQGQFLYKFNRMSCSIEIWDPDDKNKQKVEVGMIVQKDPDFLDSSWAGTLFDLDVFPSRIVAVWNRKTGDMHNYHAVFVDKIENNIFHCINSWGDSNNPTLKLDKKDLCELHYVTLYMDLFTQADNFIFLSSSGPAATQWPGYLGHYKRSSDVYEGVQYYVQLDTLRGYSRYLYWCQGHWWVSFRMMGPDGVLRGEGDNDVENVKEWSVWSGASYHNGDDTMRAVTAADVCSSVSVTLVRSWFRQWFSSAIPCDVSGTYEKTGEYSCGHGVYKHETRELFIKVLDKFGWCVTTELTSSRPLLYCPGSVGSACVAKATEDKGWLQWDERSGQYVQVDGVAISLSSV